MAIDPILSLAVSMHSSKGVYALLLGSGVSRSSGVPTGWEIIQNLIRQVAELKQEPCEPDPDAWFRKTFGFEPEYSEVLNQIAKSSAERLQVLRGYFEPTEDERREGRKQPTRAHRAIAKLVSKGYIRVIVTTNFDRLLEQALVDVGIQPAVIGTSDAAQGALPLAHSRCSVVKVNGDYLDTRLKNTRDELDRYDTALERLLDQVFDEYGLIASGWSADWDTALCGAMERCSNRRFTTYWTLRGEAGKKAQNLIVLRGAISVQIADADSFFEELSEKISALESLALTDPLSAKVAVSRLKKYLQNDRNGIDLNDLFATETERVRKAITDEHFVSTPRGSVTGATVLGRMRAYEAELGVLLALAVCGSRWATPAQRTPMLQSLKRLADEYGPTGGITLWLHLRRYPALLLMYGMGLGALASSNYEFLKALFSLGIKSERDKPEKPAVTVIYGQRVLENNGKCLPNRETFCTPLSDYLFETLREPLREHLPDDNIYDQMFDWFEYLLGLTYCDIQKTRQSLTEQKEQDPKFTLWGPVGRFAWKYRLGTEIGIHQQAELWIPAVLRTGFFESGGQLHGGVVHDDKYRDVKSAFDRHIALVRRQWGVH